MFFAVANVEDNLKISLEKQWNAEQSTERTDCSTRSRFENASEIFVIQGNIDLINETEQTAERRLICGLHH